MRSVPDSWKVVPRPSGCTVEAFSVGVARPSEQVFLHARRLREDDETLVPRDPVGRNKGVPLLPPHLFNLKISVAASDPIAHAPRLVRAWRASDGSAEEIPGTRILRERSSPQAVTVA